MLIFSVKPGQFQSLRRTFRVGFQSLVAFSNIGNGQSGRPMLEIQNESRGDAEIQYAAFERPDAANPAPAPCPA